jgi:hypothetical protein
MAEGQTAIQIGIGHIQVYCRKCFDFGICFIRKHWDEEPEQNLKSSECEHSSHTTWPLS